MILRAQIFRLVDERSAKDRRPRSVNSRSDNFSVHIEIVLCGPLLSLYTDNQNFPTGPDRAVEMRAHRRTVCDLVVRMIKVSIRICSARSRLLGAGLAVVAVPQFPSMIVFSIISR